MTVDRRYRQIRRRLREAVRDNVWLVPALGALTGLLLAMGIGTGGGPEDDPWTVTVEQSRGILFSFLGLVFTSLSIVLALASVTAQSMVDRFGSRVLRLYGRRSVERWMIAIFALSAIFILTEQFQLRRLDPDAPAPIAGLAVSVVLLVVTGGTVISYTASLVRTLRTDRSVTEVTSTTREIAGAIAQSRRGSAPTFMPSRPADAVDLLAMRSGHLAEIDADVILEACRPIDAMAVIHGPIGAPVIAGQPIGWIKSRNPDSTLHPERVVAEAIDISGTREVGNSLEYGIMSLVDIAIIALSPAVNDPNSAVEAIEEMSFLLPDLAGIPLGPYAVPDAESWPRVIVGARTFGELVDLATEQITNYGLDDPNVRTTLVRLADSLLRLDLADDDRAHVEAVATKLDAAG